MRTSIRFFSRYLADQSGLAFTQTMRALFFTIALASPIVTAQTANQTVPGNRDALAIAAVRDAVVLSEPFQIGGQLPKPATSLSVNNQEDDSTLILSCRMICSPDQPRQTLTEVSWEEPDATPGDTSIVMRPALNRLRLDIVGASAKFEDGNFGTARLSAVPGVVSQSGTGIDLTAMRLLQSPALLQSVVDNTIVARPPALLTPEALKALALPDGRATFPADALVAIERDDIAGGLGRIQLTAQTIETRRGQAYRSMIIEGMQPGQTYRLRLVDDPASPNTVAETITGSICRVRVCPADFKTQ